MITTYDSIEAEIRATVPLNEVIRRITEIYGSKYTSEMPNFDAWDQLLACKAIAEASPVHEKSNHEIHINENDNDIDNGGHKQSVNFDLTRYKLDAVASLNGCDFKTPPSVIAEYLEIIFTGFGTTNGWWLAVAQQWNPRAICGVLNKMIQLQEKGWIKFENPAAYFTKVIKFRKKRRSL